MTECFYNNDAFIYLFIHSITHFISELCRINEHQKVALDLDPYVKKLLNARRRVVLVNNILQNAQVSKSVCLYTVQYTSAPSFITLKALSYHTVSNTPMFTSPCDSAARCDPEPAVRTVTGSCARSQLQKSRVV